MNESVEYFLNKASVSQIANHLFCCDDDFVPTLSLRVGISSYAKKITSNAVRFEAWVNGDLVGLLAVYCNDQKNRIAYITSVSVLKAWGGKGIAARLMSQCVAYVKNEGMWQISLEVAGGNRPAIKLYQASGFVTDQVADPFVTMLLNLKCEKHE